MADMAVVRSFRYPGGRVWTVSVTPHPTTPNARVLRFSAGARSIDIEDWPSDWADQPDEQLITMLRQAAPRGLLPLAEEERRRRDDSRT